MKKLMLSLSAWFKKITSSKSNMRMPPHSRSPNSNENIDFERKEK
jgi:hypothetical protein